jgi:peptide/nickel transport system substrate-binding protein
MFVEWVSGSHILVRRNPDYYLGAPNVAAVVYRIIPDSNALLAAMDKGDIDMRFAITAEQVPLIEKNPDWKISRTPAYSIFHFTINNAHPIMSDRRVRQAFTYALDKKGITQTILRGLVQPAWTPITTPSWAHDSAVTKFEYDPGRARQLLDEAGWRLNPSTGVREKDGQRLAFSIVSIAGDVERQQIVQVAQRQWREVGAAVDVSLVDVGTFVTIMQSGNFAIGYGFWGAGPDPDSMLFTWWHSKGNNWLRAGLPQLDALIDEARVIQDRRRRRDIYLRAQKLIAQEATNIFLYERVFFDGTKTRVNGFRPVAGGGVNTWNAYEWWVGR